MTIFWTGFLVAQVPVLVVMVPELFQNRPVLRSFMEFWTWLPFRLVIAFTGGFLCLMLIDTHKNFGVLIVLLFFCLVMTFCLCLIIKRRLWPLTHNWDQGFHGKVCRQSATIWFLSLLISTLPYYFGYEFTRFTLGAGSFWFLGLAVATAFAYGWSFGRAYRIEYCNLRGQLVLIVGHLASNSVIDWSDERKLLSQDWQHLPSLRQQFEQRYQMISNLPPISGYERGLELFDRCRLPAVIFQRALFDAQTELLVKLETWRRAFAVLLGDPGEATEAIEVLRRQWEDLVIALFVKKRYAQRGIDLEYSVELVLPAEELGSR